MKIKQNKEFSFSLEPKYKRSIIDDKKSKDKDKTLFRLSKKVVNIQMNGEVKKKEIHVIKAFKYLKQRQVIELELEIKPEEKKEEGIKEKEISKDEKEIQTLITEVKPEEKGIETDEVEEKKVKKKVRSKEKDKSKKSKKER